MDKPLKLNEQLVQEQYPPVCDGVIEHNRNLLNRSTVATSTQRNPRICICISEIKLKPVIVN